MNIVAISPRNTNTEGVAMLHGGDCLYADEIRASDVVVADFGAFDVSSGGGLYLLQSDDGWSGCRRMMRVPDGIQIDLNGKGQWQTFTCMADTGWHVVGVVRSVYRASR